MRGVTQLYLFDDNLTDEIFTQIILTVLLPSAEQLYPEGDRVLM